MESHELAMRSVITHASAAVNFQAMLDLTRTRYKPTSDRRGAKGAARSRSSGTKRTGKTPRRNGGHLSNPALGNLGREGRLRRNSRRRTLGQSHNGDRYARRQPRGPLPRSVSLHILSGKDQLQSVCLGRDGS